MLFGLFNAPASFQGYINKILTEKPDVFVIVYLNNIRIYIDDTSQPDIEAVHWVFDQLQKHGLFANLKKYWFHQNEVWFLSYIVFALGIQIEEKKIKAIKAWLEPQSIWDIQVFLGFANFYRKFIKNFGKMAVLLTLMLKTIAPLVLARPACTRANENELGMDGDGDIGGSKMDDMIANLLSSTKKISSGAGFFTLKASLAFT